MYYPILSYIILYYPILSRLEKCDSHIPDEEEPPLSLYREGVNIQVSKSEGPNVGALENVLGNQLLKNFVALTGGITGLQIIGEVTDPTNNTFYFFLTLTNRFYVLWYSYTYKGTIYI